MLSYVNFVNNKREIFQMYFVLFILSNVIKASVDLTKDQMHLL